MFFLNHKLPIVSILIIFKVTTLIWNQDASWLVIDLHVYKRVSMITEIQHENSEKMEPLTKDESFTLSLLL